jgi:hypothetical protein
MTDTLATGLLNEVLRNTNFAPLATPFLALFTAAPGEAGGGTEVTGGSYARQSLTGVFGAPTGTPKQCSNTADLFFPVATANWGTITHFAVMDASTAGTMHLYGALTASVTINNTEQFVFRAGQLVVIFD